MFGVEVNRTVGQFDQTFSTVTKVYGLSRAKHSDAKNHFFSFSFSFFFMQVLCDTTQNLQHFSNTYDL